MIPPIAALVTANALPRAACKPFDHRRTKGAVAGAFEQGLRPVGVSPRLIAKNLKTGDALLERRVVQIGDACLDGVIEPLEARFRFGRLPLQRGDVFATAFRLILAATEDAAKQLLQPSGIEQAFLDMADHHIVELVHGDGASLAAGLPLPRLDRAGIVAVAATLAGADGHGPTAIAAIADAGQQGRPDHHAGGQFGLGVASLQKRLNGVEGFSLDDGGHRDDDDFSGGTRVVVLAALPPFMLADIGAAGQNAMNLTDAPTAAVAGEDALGVQMLDDGLDAHLAAVALTFQSEPIDQADRVGVQRVDFQLLLGLGPALFGGGDPVADRRQRTVPEALPGVLLQGAGDVLAVFLRLVFIEQRHDPPHHVVDWVVPQLLRDGNEPDIILGELAIVIFHVESIAEEAREAVNQHHIEGRGLRRARLDHALELGAAIIGGRVAGLHEDFDQLIAARRAVRLALLALVGDRHVMLGLPGGRDAQVEGSPQGDVGGLCVHLRVPFDLRRSIRGKTSSTRS
ncbi:hypothetical protein JAGODDHD_02927 [Sphingomonas paucimobilis]|nr:hypothetical protein [Sphingomonas paucimobilis]